MRDGDKEDEEIEQVDIISRVAGDVKDLELLVFLRQLLVQKIHSDESRDDFLEVHGAVPIAGQEANRVDDAVYFRQVDSDDGDDAALDLALEETILPDFQSIDKKDDGK